MKTLILSTLFGLLTTFAFAQYAVNSKANLDFSVPNASNTINGVNKKVNPAKDLKNIKGVIVVFTCNTCPFSVAYEDRIIALHKKYAPKGYPVIAINPNDVNRKPADSFDAMVDRAKDKRFPFAYLHDESQEIARTFGATRTPHFYILKKKKNEFVVQFIGALDDNSHSPDEVKHYYVENAVDALLKGQKIEKDFVRAVGCSIKWKSE